MVLVIFYEGIKDGDNVRDSKNVIVVNNPETGFKKNVLFKEVVEQDPLLCNV